MPRCCQRREAPLLLLTPNIDIRPTVYHVTESEPVVTAHAVQITILTARNGSVKRVWLVSWCFEPSQPQRIPSGLNTNFTLSPSHSFHKSSYHTLAQVISCCLFVVVGFFAYLYSAGTQHGNLHPAGRPISFCGPTQEPVLATANTGKKSRFWEKHVDEWTGKVEIRKKSLAVSVACMVIY